MARDGNIDELRKENAKLRGMLSDQVIGQEFRQAVNRVELTGTLVGHRRHRELLELITETASYVIGVTAASLLIVDEEKSELEFEVAFGEKAPQVKGLRISLGKGFAGFCATTGQSIAITGVSQDERWAADIGVAIGYVPESLLVVPLIYDNRVIGVLELIDRLDGQPFDHEDIEMAGRFAQQAAVAIDQSRLALSLTLITKELLGNPDQNDRNGVLGQQMQQLVARIQSSESFQRSLLIADDIGEIAIAGDDALKLCGDVVSLLRRFIGSQPDIESVEGRDNP